jgi:hypothetical protein
MLIIIVLQLKFVILHLGIKLKNNKMKKIPLLFILMISVLISTAQLIVTPAILPANGVQNVLAGSGVNISNIQFTGNMNALGAFTTDTLSTGLGFFSGLVLSTGLVSNVADSSSNFSSTDNGTGSDPQLAVLVSEDIHDAAVLEFDFIPSSDSVEFRYVFASEEYPEFVDASYNDVFGFFISGPNPAGGAYSNLNIARIPGTNLPISIDNVNNSSHSQFYINNSGNSRIVFDGMTVVLTAKATVVPCQTYHIKIAIGDVFDGVYDSGVFLEANSFSSIGGSFSSGAVIGDTTICTGSIASGLTLVNSTLPIVRWESSVFPYTTWTTFADTATTIYPGILTQTTVFHAVVQGICSEVSSMFATVLVDSMPIPQFSYTASGLNVDFINESTNATSYIWNFGSDTTTSVEINPSYEYPLLGQYNVELMAIKGQCEANYSQIIVLTDENIKELNAKSLTVYPNPTNGKISIRLENENSSNIDFRVIDITGKIVYEKSMFIIDGLIELDLSTLNSGIYIVKVANDQVVQQFKIMIE